jgi:flagellar P-ring protein precursor FlgI
VLTACKKKINILKIATTAYCVVLCLLIGKVSRSEQIKEIATIEGVREVQLIGYGLVVGLNGTGDKGIATLQSIANMLQRMNLTVRPKDIKAKNVAAVMVTATIPPFAKLGMKVDALVSTIGDAKSLQGGTLLLTPLKGPDGIVYALAQGPVSVGGFIGGKGGTRTQKNFPTTGKVPGGVIIERELPFVWGNTNEIRILLDRPDFSLASEIAKKINATYSAEYAIPVDPATVTVKIPEEYRENTVGFVTDIEKLDVPVDTSARVIINERTGTVIIGERVKVYPVAIAHGDLTIEIKTEFGVSQPPPFAPPGSETVIVPQREVRVEEKKASLVEVSGATLGEVVKALNALGVTPRDLISILQALKAAGALRGELEII